MAAVYAATNRTGERAAIKILHPELALVPGIRERFVREAHVSRQVNHPSCVAYVDEGVTEQGEAFLGMELLEGQTLEAFCQQRGGRLAVPEALRLAGAVLDALIAFHASSVVHRDLKPGNIFLTSRGEVKLLDLGIAQLHEVGRDATRPGLAVGTPAYMSPEQAMGRRHLVDARSDLYALGATLHVVLSGVRLHHGVNEDEALVRAATQPAASLARVAPDLPIDVIALVDKALQWDRRNRFQSAVEMRQVVDRLLAELASSDTPDAAPAAPPAASESWRGVDLDLDLDLDLPPPAAALPAVRSNVPAAAELELSLAPDEADTAELDVSRGPVELTPTPSSGWAGLDLESLPPPRWVAATPPAPRPRPDGARPAGSTLASTEDDQAGADGELAETPSAAELSPPLRVVFERMDRLLRTARQYGPAHPETQTRIEPVHRAILDALEADGAQVHWRVLPFCFMHDDVVAWEPPPPGDLVPYNLSVAGLREVSILPGVSEEELRDLFGAMMIDANSDPADVAATLWEAPFSRIECRLEEDLPGDESATLDDLAADTEDLQRELQRELAADPGAAHSLARSMTRGDVAEAAAMATTLDPGRASATAALALDPTTTAALRAELALPAEELAARHIDVVLEAWADAMTRRDPSIMASTFAAFARRLIRTGRHEELFATHQAFLERLAGPAAGSQGRWPAAQLLTAALFPDDVLRHVVHMVTQWAHLLSAEHVELARAGLGRVTATLGPGALPRCLGIIRQTPDGPALELLLDYVARVAAGQEPTVVAELESLRPLVAQHLLGRLARDAGPQARSWLEPLLHSPSSALRCEALALLSPSSEQLCAELLQLFASDAADARRAALDTFVRHRVISAGPALVRLVQHDSFSERPIEEQRQMLEALFALNPHRSESLLVSLLRRHGLIPDAALDETRMLALTVLGERAASQETLDAVQGAARRRPWNTAKLREVATAAAAAIGRRLATGGSSGGTGP